MDKVSVLGIDHRTWDSMSPQQQLLFTTQQLMNYIASHMYGEMEGPAVHVIDPVFPNKPRSVLQIGKPPKVSPIIGAN